MQSRQNIFKKLSQPAFVARFNEENIFMQGNFLYQFYEVSDKIQKIDQNLSAIELLEFAGELKKFFFDLKEHQALDMIPLFFLPFLFIRKGSQLQFFGDILMNPYIKKQIKTKVFKNSQLEKQLGVAFCGLTQQKLYVKKVASLLYYWARRSRKLRSPKLREFLKKCVEDQKLIPSFKTFFDKLDEIKNVQYQNVYQNDIKKQATPTYSFPSLRLLSMNNLVPKLLTFPRQLQKKSRWTGEKFKDDSKTVQFYCNDYLNLDKFQQNIFVCLVGALTLSINFGEYRHACYALYSQMKLFQSCKEYNISKQSKIIIGVLNQVKKIVQKGGQRQRAIRTLQKILTSYKQFAQSIVKVFNIIFQNKRDQNYRNTRHLYSYMKNVFKFDFILIRNPEKQIQFLPDYKKVVYIVEQQDRFGIGYSNRFQPNKCFRQNDDIYFEEVFNEEQNSFNKTLLQAF